VDTNENNKKTHTMPDIDRENSQNNNENNDVLQISCEIEHIEHNDNIDIEVDSHLPRVSFFSILGFVMSVAFVIIVALLISLRIDAIILIPLVISNLICTALLFGLGHARQRMFYLEKRINEIENRSLERKETAIDNNSKEI